MNRQIKFRAWDSKNKKFPFIGFHIIGECTAFDLINQYRLEELNDLVVTQYTGLQDAKGNDIYEGDLVKFRDDFTAEIIWCEEDAAFQVKSENKGGAFLNSNYMLNFEIIGNIFENTDLLKKI